MNAITYFRLKSPYEGDVTKNCALTGSEVDNNFYTLEGRDVKSVEIIDDRIVVNLMNGETLTTDSITDDCIKDLTIDFDEVNGVLTITKDNVVKTITGFITQANIDDIISQHETPINNAISVDGTLVGDGLSKSPVGISPVSKTGQYRPVKNIINVTEGERLPNRCNVFPGDRFLTIENINDYGYLYNYEGLKQIACALRERNSEWRIPTKEDWDDMLDAVEPDERFRNHTDARTNKYLGKFAGKFLKSKEFWKTDDCCIDDCNCETTSIDYSENGCNEECSCGKHRTCHPDYCGEYGTCHHRHGCDNKGIDKYGFRIIPAGYANEAKDYMYFKERAYFWTASNHQYRDAYVKIFAYNKSSVLQDVMATDNYMSVRLVKDFNGNNFNGCEDILGGVYSTVLMPSMKHGKAIWTSINISIGDCGCGCKHILPNDGQGMEYTKRYFINEWTGREWLRKELLDGESVVVIGQDKTYAEYRNVDGELVNVATLIYDDVIATITPKIDIIETNIENLEEKINNEIERSTAKDNELEGTISTVNENLVTAVNTINQNMADGFNTINENMAQGFNTINAAIEAERQIRAEKDTELENAINTEKEERISDVQALQEEDVRINGRIDVLEEKVDNLEQDLNDKIEQEKTERETKDAEIEAQLLTQEGTEFDKDNGILTLKSKGGTNDVQVQFNFNFGTF